MTGAANLDLIFPRGLAGIVFDCDGVMINSEAANRFFYNTVLAELGLPPMTREQEEYAFMATARQALLAMIPANLHGLIDDACARSIDYPRDVLPRTELMPGFGEFIAMAHASGLRLAIDTNRTAEGIQRVLDFFDLPNYFDPVISISCAEPKPSPDGPRRISADWEVEPCRMLFVGDSENDRKTALGAGIPFAAFGPHAPAGDLRAPDFATLGSLLWPFCEARGDFCGNGLP